MQEKEVLIKVTYKMNTITLLKWKVALTITHENEILDFVLNNRALGDVVINNETMYKLWSIDEKSWNLPREWCYLFMQVNNLIFRRSTHISQKLAENYLKWIQEFLYYNIKFRSIIWFWI